MTDRNATQPVYGAGGGTAVPRETDQPLDWLQSWAASPGAVPYGGLWVLFDSERKPVDSDLSPTALRSRAGGVDDSVIVYVEPFRS